VAISSLLVVDITNNLISGELSFVPQFELIRVTDKDPSLPLNSTIEVHTETAFLDTSSDASGIELPLIIGISAGALILILLAIAFLILVKRRKEGKESDIELKLLPKYSSPNQQIRLMRKINSGGFGVVWEARYKGEKVAMKLIRTEKYNDKENDLERNVNMVKMVADESLIMGLMVHERIVRFIMFEVESLGIVLEYLPLGSLYDYIASCKGVMFWNERYQMMLDICEGMEFLHSNVYANGSKKKVLFHQDLKSGNVLLCMEGNDLRGKISDFGLSCKFLFHLTLDFSLEGQSYKQKQRNQFVIVKGFHQRWDKLLSGT
jgi:hypothetical protein